MILFFSQPYLFFFFCSMLLLSLFFFFFFNDTATTEIYTLSLHDALPISRRARGRRGGRHEPRLAARRGVAGNVRRLAPGARRRPCRGGTAMPVTVNQIGRAHV